ncbi:MAG TPA: NAD(P)/FAD-dependent oxidoreductase [Gemmatimonadales bacterium]|nr:NAD(P)/FAD-dependent oxidoreductase [Gemmatimonadales bacterium]
MPKRRRRVDVLVIGAGAAGLAAARDLSHSGLRLTVVEARPRIGGRILTLHDPRAPLPVELGAEFIHGEAPETFAVAEAARLLVLELPGLHEVASAGRFTPLGNFWGTIDRMNRDLARRIGRRGKDLPVSEYLSHGRLPPARRAFLEDFIGGYQAAHPERLSARALAEQAEEGGREHKQFRIASGEDALVRWLRDGLDPERTEVRLSTVAEILTWKPGQVTLTCRGGDGALLEPLRATAAVVTLPHAVLRAGSLRFDPALPAKQRALAGIETGHVFKIVLLFRRAFWDDPDFLTTRRARGHATGAGLNFLHAHGAELPTWWTAAPARAALLTGWVGGKRAESLLAQPLAIRLERSVAALASILAVPRRELEDQLEAWATHDWRADPFSRGAYSYIGVGGGGAPQALARPVAGTLFFAGEATNGAESGTVAGALASGHRAAREVLRSIRST